MDIEDEKVEIKTVYNLPHDKFLDIFGLSHDVFFYVHDEVKEDLESNRRGAGIRLTDVPTVSRLACVLRSLHTGNIQRHVTSDGESQYWNISQPAISLYVDRVLDAIEKRLCPKWIIFPCSNESKTTNKLQFLQETGLTDVIGCVACTDVRIIVQNENLKLFANGTGIQTINIQLTCDYNLRILSVDARYPGSTSHQDIWNCSEERRELERNFRNGDKNCLIGNATYQLQPWLITPFRIEQNDISTIQKLTFNKKHSLAHKRIAKCIEIWKKSFNILAREELGLRYSPQKVSKMINCCCALYNIALARGCYDHLIVADDPDCEEDFNIDIKNSLKNDEHLTNPFYKVGDKVRHRMLSNLNFIN